MPNKTYPDRGNFVTHGTIGISNAIGYEVEISKDGGCARAMYMQDDGQCQITHWVAIRHEPDPDDPNEMVTVFEAFGSDINLNEMIKI